MKITTPFIGYKKEISDDTYRLICIPHAGSGASTFKKWQEVFGEGFEILPIQLPGHENRMREPLIRNCNEVSDLIVEAMMPYIRGKRFSIFGHSMGGVVAFNTAKKFILAGESPDICFISSTYTDENTDKRISDELDDEEFIDRVIRYGGIDKDNILLNTPGLKEIFIDILKADFSIAESCTDDGTKLSCPIVCFCADSDPMVKYENMLSWKNYTTNNNVPVHCYIGDHFYLNDNLNDICSKIKETIYQNTR